MQEHGLRPDGRMADEARPVTVNTGQVALIPSVRLNYD